MEYRNNAKDLAATAKSLSDSMAEVNNSRAEVDQAIADAKAGIAGAKSDYDSTFSVKAKELKKTVSGILDSLDGISGDLDSAVGGLTDASGSLAKGLSKAAKLVNKASDQLGEASDKISAFKDELDGALMSDDLATIKTMIGNDPEGLAVSLSGPVALDRKPVYPIRNYGSAMAPFYTILSLWVGSIVLAAMMKVSVDDELINELIPVRLHEIYRPLPVLWRSGPAAGNARVCGRHPVLWHPVRRPAAVCAGGLGRESRVLQYRLHAYGFVWRYRQGARRCAAGHAGRRFGRHVPHRDDRPRVPCDLSVPAVHPRHQRHACRHGRCLPYGVLD